MDPTRVPLVIALTLLVAFMGLPQTTSAQSTYTLEGMVCGAGDGYCAGGLGGTSLTLTKKGTVPALDETETFQSDADGHYSVGGLSGGEYQLSATRGGFEDYATTLQIDGDTKHDVLMAGKKVTVSGSVTSDGTAIVDASIYAYGNSGDASATSGSDGAFSFEVTAGYYHLEVQATGYRSYHAYVLLDGDEALAIDLEDIPDPTVPVSGRVTDKAGAPVADAKIVAHQWGYCCYAEPGEPQPAGAEPESDDAPRSTSPGYYGDDRFEATTDADGRYSFKVRPGWVDLQVTKESYTRHQSGFEAQEGQEYTQDATIKKIPAKTATIEGKITDAGSGKGLRYVSISLRNAEYGVHECSREAGSGSGGSASGSTGSAEPAPGDSDGDAAYSTVVHPDYYERECLIEVQSDGSFTATVTPGYTILNVYFDHWRACSEQHDSDGSYRRDCAPEYFSYVVTLDLAPNSSTERDIGLRQRPGPDATVSGYVVDKATQQAISGAQISFSRQDTYDHGWATTDGDGSYKVRLRSGYQQVSVWAEGYLQWQGTVLIAAGDDRPFDVLLTEGQEQYGGGCCYAYAEDRAMASSDGAYAEEVAYAGSPSGAPAMMGEDDGRLSGVDAESSDSDATFEDLGGGLGPYDADARQKLLSEHGGNDVPAPALVLLLVGLIGAVVMVRRRIG